MAGKPPAVHHGACRSADELREDSTDQASGQTSDWQGAKLVQVRRAQGEAVRRANGKVRMASESERLHENSVRLSEQLRRYDLPALDGRVGQGAREEVVGSGIHQGCRPSLLHHASLPRDRATVVVAKWFGPLDDRKQRWRDQFRHCSFGTLIRSSDHSCNPPATFTNRLAARKRSADLSGDLRPRAHRLRFAAMIASRDPAWQIAWTGSMRRRGELRPELRFCTRAAPKRQQGLPTTDFRRMIGLSSYDP